MTPIGKEHIAFLRKVNQGEKLGLACRKQDKIRQKLRRMGYAEYIGKPKQWVLADAGINLLHQWGMVE